MPETNWTTRPWHRDWLQARANDLFDLFQNNAVNPKGTVFLLAVVPQFLDLAAPMGPQYLVIAGTLGFTDLVVMGGYTALAARVWPQAVAFLESHLA